MFLRKAEAGSAPGFTWQKAGDVLEVPDELGERLLAIPRGGFTVAEAPAPDPVAKTPVQEAPAPATVRGRKAASGPAR